MVFQGMSESRAIITVNYIGVPRLSQPALSPGPTPDQLNQSLWEWDVKASQMMSLGAENCWVHPRTGCASPRALCHHSCKGERLVVWKPVFAVLSCWLTSCPNVCEVCAFFLSPQSDLVCLSQSVGCLLGDTVVSLPCPILGAFCKELGLL